MEKNNPPNEPTTTLSAPTTTLEERTPRPIPTTTLPPGEEEGTGQTSGPLNVVVGNPVDDGLPAIIGYSVLPLDYADAFRTAGFNYLLLLCLIAGYTLWARDTQLMRNADKGNNKKKGK